MVVAMRLMRMGHIHRPVYRISVADSRRAPTGKFIEHIGTYDPHLDKMGNKMLRLNVARAKYWIAHGAQPSSVVARLLSRFHLLPVPPQRQLALVDPLVFKALAGQDIRAELAAQTEAVVARDNAGTPDVLIHPPTLGNRRQKELTPERIEQVKRQAPWKLQTFPFDYNPTTNTMAAWNQARLFHQPDPSDALINLRLKPEEVEEDEKYIKEIEEAEKKQELEEREALKQLEAEEKAEAELAAKEGKTLEAGGVDAEGADAQTASIDAASSPSEAELEAELKAETEGTKASDSASSSSTTIDVEAVSSTTTPIVDASKKQ